MLSRAQLEAVEQLLVAGVPKLRVVKELHLSRKVVERIATGRHPLQTEPAKFLDAYARRPAVEQTRHHLPLKVVQRVEVMIWKRLPRRHIAKRLGISESTVWHIARGFHPAQRERGVGYAGGQPMRALRGWCHAPETVAAIQAAAGDGDRSLISIAQEFGVTMKTVRNVARSRHLCQVSAFEKALRIGHMQPFQPSLRPRDYLPSPRKIAKLCAAIRRTWTAAVREERWCGPAHWTPQECAVLVA